VWNALYMQDPYLIIETSKWLGKCTGCKYTVMRQRRLTYAVRRVCLETCEDGGETCKGHGSFRAQSLCTFE